MINGVLSIVQWAGGGFWAWVFAISVVGMLASGSAALILSGLIALRNLLR